jgi:hypothetical protein
MNGVFPLNPNSCLRKTNINPEEEKGTLLTKLNYSWEDFGVIHKKVGVFQMNVSSYVPPCGTTEDR